MNQQTPATDRKAAGSASEVGSAEVVRRASFRRANFGVKTWWVALLTAIIGTLAYYIPTLGALAPDHAQWPGFMLTGDQMMAYFPSFVEGYRRFWHGGLLGIDFFTDDGASVFAYRANLMPFYPPYVLAYLLVNCSNVRTGMLAYVAISIAHQFVGLYFTVVFVRRYLLFPMASAVLASALYGLTWYAASYTGEATFYFQMMLLPLAACTLCWLMAPRSRLAALWASPIFVVFMLSNYGPTMIAGLAFTIIAALLAFAVRIDPAQPRRWSSLTLPLLSLVIAALACAPYFLAQVHFKSLSQPTSDDLDAVAHDLSLNAHDLVNGLSQFLDLSRTKYESFLVWGMIPLFLALAGLDVILVRKAELPSRYIRICGAAALIYVAVLLPTFGLNLLSAADFFYYTVPFLGKMHIFQRYLIFGQFFFSIAVAGLATVAVFYGSSGAKRIMAYSGLALWLGVTVLVQFVPLSAATDTGGLLVEVFLTAVTGIVLAVASPTPALILAAVLVALIGLYPAYVVPLNTNRPTSWMTEPDPLGSEMDAMVDFMKANDGDKVLSKIAIASPIIWTYFDRNLPWVIADRVKVMNYQGYPMHLAVLAGYGQVVSGNYGDLNIDWLKKSDTDFVFWDDTEDAALDAFMSAGYRIGPSLALPGSRHLAKLSLATPAPTDSPQLLDLASADPSTWPAAMVMKDWAIRDGHIVKVGSEQSQFGYRVPIMSGTTYDVDLDVDPGASGRFVVAIANQPLGVFDATGAHHLSFRVPATSAGDLWITGLSTFKGSLSNIIVSEAPDEAPPATSDNGILRYTGPGDGIQSFETNFTTQVKASLDVAGEGELTYLLWPNPYMVPYLDGARTAWDDAAARPVSIKLKPGHHDFEMRFESRAGTLFVWSTLCYLVLLGGSIVFAFLPPPLELYRRGKRMVVARAGRSASAG